MAEQVISLINRDCFICFLCAHRKKSVVVSLGHSMADLATAEEGIRSGASLITHLFNAMLPVCALYYIMYEADCFLIVYIVPSS